MAKGYSARRGFSNGAGQAAQQMQMQQKLMQMQQEMAKAQQEVEEATFTASVGGGAVSAAANGKKEITALTIKPEAVDPEDVEMLQDLVISAVNEALRQALEDAYHGQGVLTVPFTDQVPAYMHAADVLLSKAGGISSSEAAMLGVPLVHTMAIPGVETENAAFFARHGLSFFARSVDAAARFADRLIYDPACAERMLAAQAAWLPRNGAEQIAAAVTAQ